MKLPPFPVLDAAAFIAACTAILYLFGLANSQGDAYILQLPSAILKRDLWDTVALGAESLLVSVVFPFAVAFADGTPQWKVILIFLGGAFVSLLIYFLFRKKSWGFVLLTTWTIGALYLYLYISSATLMTLQLARVQTCLANTKICDSSIPYGRIVYSVGGDAIEERTGSLLLASHEYFVLYTIRGILVVPKGSVRFVESGRPG